jgi:hypothetical protein
MPRYNETLINIEDAMTELDVVTNETMLSQTCIDIGMEIIFLRY